MRFSGAVIAGIVTISIRIQESTAFVVVNPTITTRGGTARHTFGKRKIITPLGRFPLSSSSLDDDMTTTTTTTSSPSIDTQIETVKNNMNFRNDGPYWFMKTILPTLFKDGSRLNAGIATTPTTAPSISPAAILERRRKATEENINIDEDERERRRTVGTYLMAVAAVVGAYVALFVDEGDLVGHLLRFLAVIGPGTLGYGFYESGSRGL